MKRILSLLAAAGVMLGSVAGASAVDFKVSGSYEFGFEYVRNYNNMDWGKAGASEDSFGALQRATFRLEAIANENLRGVYIARIGKTFWGVQDGGTGLNSGGGIGTQGVNVDTREAFLDWKPSPESYVRMGLQGVVLPAAVAGSPVMDTRVAGVTAGYEFNKNVAANVFWYRPSNEGDGPGATRFAKWDMFGLTLPLTFDGVKVTPWGVYSQMGRNATQMDMFAAPGYMLNGGPAGQKIKPWWVGLAAEISIFDPLVLKLDAIYSGAKGSGKWNPDAKAFWDAGRFDGSDYDSRGWLVIAKLQYKMDSFTPGIIGWYGSGDEIENGKRKLRRLNIIEPSFQATSFGFDGSYSLTSRSCNMGISPEGTWAVGLLAEDIKFVENVKHHVRVLYYRGTNDYSDSTTTNFGGAGMSNTTLTGGPSLKPGNGGLYLTKKDWALEVNVDTIYTIMDHLNVAFELGYMYVDCKNTSAFYNYNNVDAFEKNAYKIGMYFVYDF